MSDLKADQSGKPVPADPADDDARRPEIVYRWDLDKTYVQTDFSSVRGLFRAATEKAENKRVVPGMALTSA